MNSTPGPNTIRQLQPQLTESLRAVGEAMQQARPDRYQSQVIYLRAIYKNESGTIQVEWNIGGYSETSNVSGADLPSCLAEWLRRQGWTEANKAVAEPPRLSGPQPAYPARAPG